MTAPRMLWVTGWGADERSLTPQLAAFNGDSTYAGWMHWWPDESLKSYARRLAEKYDDGKPVILCGFSMGGMLVQEMTAHLDVRQVFLLGSIKGPDELPRRVRWLRNVHLAPNGWLWLVHQTLCFGSRFGYRRRWLRDHLLRQMDDTPTDRLLRAGRAVTYWQTPSGFNGVPVHHIHGERDVVLPVRYTHPDHIIHDAGHVITLSHPDIVNNFIRERL